MQFTYRNELIQTFLTKY